MNDVKFVVETLCTAMKEEGVPYAVQVRILGRVLYGSPDCPIELLTNDLHRNN